MELTELSSVNKVSSCSNTGPYIILTLKGTSGRNSSVLELLKLSSVNVFPSEHGRSYNVDRGGCLFIYSCSARLVSFEIKFNFIHLKRN